MPRGMYKSKSLRKTYRKTPSSRVVTHYKKRKSKKSHCANCGALLSGVARERPFKMQNIPKTKKRPQRPYGGYYCSKCMRKVLIEKARS